jgi:hypothetical protein
MIVNFKIFENSLYTPLKKLLDDDNEEINDNDLEKIIGFKSKYFDLEIDNDNNFTLYLDEEFFCDFVNVENGIFTYLEGVQSDYGYEHYVDESEIEYINNYLNDDNIKLIEKICKLLDIENTDENVRLLLYALGDSIEPNEFIWEISYANGEVIKKEAYKAIKDLPFSYSRAYSYRKTYGKKNFDFEIELNINDIVEYINKHNLKDIETVSDFLYNVDYSYFSYEIENVWESEFDPDYTELNKIAETKLDNIIEDLEEFTSMPQRDHNQLTLFDKDVLDNMEAEYILKSDLFSKLKIDNVESAKQLGGKLLAWFKSYFFQKKYMEEGEGEKLYKYKKLKELGILNSIIDDEYGHLESAVKFNL